jgi:hypothetical protein
VVGAGQRGRVIGVHAAGGEGADVVIDPVPVETGLDVDPLGHVGPGEDGVGLVLQFVRRTHLVVRLLTEMLGAQREPVPAGLDGLTGKVTRSGPVVVGRGPQVGRLVSAAVLLVLGALLCGVVGVPGALQRVQLGGEVGRRIR